jgi:hypothetical protein
MIVTKIIVFVIFSPLGLYLMIKAEPLVRLFGKNSWAERVMPGGSYTMWKLIGLIVIILGFVFLMGGLDWLVYPGQ